MPSSHISLEPEKIYHVYTHANGSENLFREADNYRYFLEKYGKYIYPIAETFAYCLMPNHLHLMVRVRKEEGLVEFFKINTEDPSGFQNLTGLISKQFSHLFNAYTKAYNKKYDRSGSLFHRPFKRKPVENDAYFTALIVYIHNNPLHHGFVKDINDWPNSSWHGYLQSKPSKLARKEGIEWFGSKEEFIKIHAELKKKDIIQDFES